MYANTKTPLYRWSTVKCLSCQASGEEYPTSCSPKKVFPTKFKLAWKF